MRKRNRYKILCIDHEGGYGGSSRSLFYLIKNLDRNIFEIEVWCGKEGPIQKLYKGENISVKIFKIPTISTVFSFLGNIISIFNFIRMYFSNYKIYKELSDNISNNFDLIHFNHPNLYLFALFFKLRNKKKPLFFICELC